MCVKGSNLNSSDLSHHSGAPAMAHANDSIGNQSGAGSVVFLCAGYNVTMSTPFSNLDGVGLDVLKAETTRICMMFRSLPRDPKGKLITMSSILAEITSNGIRISGDTPYDFYHVYCMPEVGNLLNKSTESMLVAWTKGHGELKKLDWEVADTESEEIPREVLPFDIARLVRDTDITLSMRLQTKSVPPAMEDGISNKSSVFGASAYPAPWPLLPFNYPAPVLQNYIPFHLLPKKLIVHDPWSVLAVSNSRSDYCDWRNVSDKTYVYVLRLSPEGQSRAQINAYRAAEEMAKVQETFGFDYALVDGRFVSPSGDTVCHVELPPMPEPEPVEEAHLYLSPAHLAGRGNHSVVYNAEWEVPRSMLIPPSICQECIQEDVSAILREQHGKDERKNVGPQLDWDNEAVSENSIAYHEGPVRSITSHVRWRSADEPYSTACSHTYPRHPYPSATKVRVIAKLSLANDRHLNNEAINYQKFPAYFFKYWNRRHTIPPLNDPTPMGALVPQFYGFYVPEQQHREYLSPIMLLEDCGVPVNPKMLSVDDRNECASLYYRFHNAGWCHGSVAARNILVQRGPLSARPRSRGGFGSNCEAQERSFRLIDFGRSKENAQRGFTADMEKVEVEQLLRRLPPWNRFSA